MGLFDRLFGTSTSQSEQPNIRFGRYTDSYKTAEKFHIWDRALTFFENGQYLKCYEAFFEYLRDDEEDNVSFRVEEDRIHFEFFQGSKKITGFANEERLWAEAKIAYSASLNVGFMRRLIEKNFVLLFSRFALDNDNNIVIVFGTYSIDGSPYKLYHALKELATNADKQDDLLLDEFQMLKPVDTSHLEPLSEEEKEIKYNYIYKEITATLQEVNTDKLDKKLYPRGISMLLLDLVYRLDYLIKPEGYMMESLERMHRQYFAQDGKMLLQKNEVLEKQLKELVSRPKDEFFKEMYRVKATFGITAPINHDRIVDFIDAELEGVDWYKDHDHERIAMAIPGYLVGYCLFYFAIPKPDRDFFHLFYQIIDAKYFRDLGFTVNYCNEETGTFNKKAIRRAIEQITVQNKANYPNLNPAVNALQYHSKVDFARSYLSMIRHLDMTKVE